MPQLGQTRPPNCKQPILAMSPWWHGLWIMMANLDCKTPFHILATRLLHFCKVWTLLRFAQNRSIANKSHLQKGNTKDAHYHWLWNSSHCLHHKANHPLVMINRTYSHHWIIFRKLEGCMPNSQTLIKDCPKNHALIVIFILRRAGNKLTIYLLKLVISSLVI